jgi:hypothetical protein
MSKLFGTGAYGATWRQQAQPPAETQPQPETTGGNPPTTKLEILIEDNDQLEVISAKLRELNIPYRVEFDDKEQS